jgi:hypothetical protein
MTAEESLCPRRVISNFACLCTFSSPWDIVTEQITSLDKCCFVTRTRNSGTNAHFPSYTSNSLVRLERAIN